MPAENAHADPHIITMCRLLISRSTPVWKPDMRRSARLTQCQKDSLTPRERACSTVPFLVAPRRHVIARCSPQLKPLIKALNDCFNNCLTIVDISTARIKSNIRIRSLQSRCVLNCIIKATKTIESQVDPQKDGEDHGLSQHSNHASPDLPLHQNVSSEN